MDPCVALPMDGDYFLVFAFDDPVQVGLPVDDQQQPGVVYRRTAGVWNDTFGDPTFSGKPILQGLATCATPPVDVDATAWGTLKSLYR